MQKDKPDNDKLTTDVIFYGLYLETSVRRGGMLRNYLVLQVTNIEDRIPHNGLFNQVVNSVNDYHSSLKNGNAVTVVIGFVPEQNLDKIVEIFYKKGATLREIATRDWESAKERCEEIINCAKKYQNEFNKKELDNECRIDIELLVRDFDKAYRMRNMEDNNT